MKYVDLCVSTWENQIFGEHTIDVCVWCDFTTDRLDQTLPVVQLPVDTFLQLYAYI